MTTIYVADVLVQHAIEQTRPPQKGAFEIGIYKKEMHAFTGSEFSSTLTNPSWNFDRSELIERYEALVTANGGNQNLLVFVDTEEADARSRRESFYRVNGNWDKATYVHENFPQE